MFLTLHLWHDPEVITQLAGICAFGRTEQDGEELFAPQREFLSQKYQAQIVTITLPGLVDVSSTRLRELLARGEGQEYLLPQVYGYILMNRLYGTHADLKRLELPELRACSYSMIRAKRVPHVMGVEEEAVRLAERWAGTRGWPAGPLSSTTAPSIWNWTTSSACAGSTGWSWMSWNSRR